MRSKKCYYAAACLVAICSCSMEEQDHQGIAHGQVMVFEAMNCDEPLTKTEVQNDGISVWWSPEEDINIFCGASESSKFTSTNTDPVAKAQFTGIIPTPPGGISGTNYYWAVYPYDSSNTCDGTSVTATLSSTQTAKAESFANNQWMTMAKSEGMELSFYAVCAGFRFSVTKAGVKSVTFRGNNNEVLAGKARIGMDANNHPVVLENVTEVKEITLSAPSGHSLEVGSLYYITFFPTSFTQGFTITFNTDTETGTRVYDKAVAFNRTEVHRGRDFDSNVSYRLNRAQDLGLSVKWAAYNIGAEAIEETGDVYAWGETATKNEYNWSTYIFNPTGDGSTFTKYTGTDYFTLQSEDDVATQVWGGSWRMPTQTEIYELADNCTLEEITINSVTGIKFTSKKPGYTDKWIFLPTAGVGAYWTSSLNDANFSTAWIGGIVYGDSPILAAGISSRQFGRFIRPVTDEVQVSVASVNLNKTNTTIPKGGSEVLVATVFPSNATDKTVTWYSSNETVATVEQNGTVHAVNIGSAVISASCGGVTKQCNVTVSSNMTVGNPVDLGLSVMWSDINVGGSTADDYGNYYAWGELSTKTSYTFENYIYGNGTSFPTTFTKYTGIDHTTLQPTDDVATVEWGGSWRMPTQEEIEELISTKTNTSEYSWSWQTSYGSSGHAGYLITHLSSNNSIFLPSGDSWGVSLPIVVGEYGRYWSSTLWALIPNYSTEAYGLSFNNSAAECNYDDRSCGRLIRPVYNNLISVSGVDVAASAQVIVNHSNHLRANVSPYNATDKTVNWTTSNSNIVSVDNYGRITGVAEGTATITAETVDGGYTSTCLVTVVSTSPYDVPAVDMGLSVKWASWNVGASNETDPGDYFAWGEISPKYSYDWSTYDFNSSVDGRILTRYVGTDYATLLPSDDVAMQIWGGSWRMPTRSEIQELRATWWDTSNYTWAWQTNYLDSGHAGWLITRKSNGNHIFLPAAGYKQHTSVEYINSSGMYWSSSHNTSSEIERAFSLCLSYNNVGSDSDASIRFNGFSIRPVTE